LEEAEAHLWKAVDAYKLAKDNSIAPGNSEKFLPCLELLMSILEQRGGAERLRGSPRKERRPEGGEASRTIMAKGRKKARTFRWRA